MNLDVIPKEYKYKAFISYRHVPRDMAAAKWLHSQIEHYTVPKSRNNAALYSYKKWKVFRDAEELRLTNDLSKEICEALDDSEFLIVICSPEALESRWVPHEISYFLGNHNQDHVLTVVTAGDPSEIIPELWTRVCAAGNGQIQMTEPLFLDIRAKHLRYVKRLLREQFLKLAATLHGCAYDDLVMREQRRKRAQRLQRLSVAACFIASIIAILLWSNWKITGKNQELEQKNQQLVEQKNEILLRESEVLTNQALAALSEGDNFSAIQYAVSALPSSDNDRPYYVPAEQALIASTGILNNQPGEYVFSEAVMEYFSSLWDYCLISDGNAIASVDQQGMVSLYDLKTNRQVWANSFPEVENFWEGAIMYCSETDSVIVSSDSNVICSMACSSGDINWAFEGYGAYSRAFLSHDQKYIIRYGSGSVYDEDMNCYVQVPHMVVISSESGQILQDINLNDQLNIEGGHLDYVYTGRDIPGCISADNTSFIGWIASEGYVNYFVVDLTNGNTEIVLRTPCPNLYFADPFFVDGVRQCITIQASHEDIDVVRIMKFDCETQEVLWTVDFPAIDDDLHSFYEEIYYSIADDFLVVARQNAFVIYDVYSGTQIGQVNLESCVEHLFQIDKGVYGAILNDGSFVTISMGTGRMGEKLFDVSQVCSMGINIENLLYCNDLSYLMSRINGGAVETVYDADGNLVIAVVAQDDISNIRVKRSFPIANSLITMQEELDGYIFSDCTFTPIGEQYIAIGPIMRIAGKKNGREKNEYLYEVVDSDDLRSVCCVPVSDDEDQVYFLPDGTGYIYDGTMYDFDGKIIRQLHMPKSEFVKAATVNGALLYLYTSRSNDKIQIWYGEKDYPAVQIPEDLVNYMYDFGHDDCLGNNGYYVWSVYGELVGGQHYFAVLDPFDNEWFRIETGHTYDSLYPNYESWKPFCIGKASPLFAFRDSQGKLRIYNCDDGTLVNEFSLDISLKTAINMEFVADDSYIMLETESGWLLILDVADGTMVYHEMVCSNHYSYTWSTFFDEQEHHLFVDTGEASCSVCIDTRTWTKLLDVPYLLGYDARTKSVYQAVWNEEQFGYLVTATYFPPADELIEIAREYVGMDEE